MLSFSRALRFEMKKKNVFVTALCPGPTETEFFGGAGIEKLAKKYESFHMSSDTVAKDGLAGLWKNKSVVIPGAMNKASAFASMLMPQDFVAAQSAKFFKNN